VTQYFESCSELLTNKMFYSIYEVLQCDFLNIKMLTCFPTSLNCPFPGGPLNVSQSAASRQYVISALRSGGSQS
jgi:hypothetical protein